MIKSPPNNFLKKLTNQLVGVFVLLVCLVTFSRLAQAKTQPTGGVKPIPKVLGDSVDHIFPPINLTSASNTSLLVQVTPLTFDGESWTYKVHWQRTLSRVGSLFVTLKSDKSQTVYSANPAQQTDDGSQVIKILPSTAYRLEFYQQPDAGPILLLRKFFTTLPALAFPDPSQNPTSSSTSSSTPVVTPTPTPTTGGFVNPSTSTPSSTPVSTGSEGITGRISLFGCDPALHLDNVDCYNDGDANYPGYATTVTVYDEADYYDPEDGGILPFAKRGPIVATTTSASDGTYKIVIKPGFYDVCFPAPNFGDICKLTTVVSGVFNSVHINSGHWLEGQETDPAPPIPTR